MKARELFEELGYQRFDYPGAVEYTIPDNKESIFLGPDTVYFDFDDNEVSLSYCGEHVLLNMNIMKPIIKQLEEFGWLEEDE